ncbi:hypothetical protein C1646_687293 [Rhizophagus diaphanus]|nr:hypothetical protein C1646_687293 [Rhizophagus diaphanus] [Rhizophagus sp. MUCL 43196]
MAEMVRSKECTKFFNLVNLQQYSVISDLQIEYGLLSFENANGPSTDVSPKDAKSSVTKTSDSADPELSKDLRKILDNLNGSELMFYKNYKNDLNNNTDRIAYLRARS